MPANIDKWDVEDNEFWERTGKRIARRNLWISIPSLLCGFAVWLYWGIITVQMLNLGFPFDQAELFTLMSIAGLTGATLRIPSTFFVRIAECAHESVEQGIFNAPPGFRRIGSQRPRDQHSNLFVAVAQPVRDRVPGNRAYCNVKVHQDLDGGRAALVSEYGH